MNCLHAIKNFSLAAVMLFYFAQSAPLSSAPAKPLFCTGVFTYDVLIDGKKTGSANMKKELRDGKLHTYSEVTFLVDGISAVTKETIVENDNFSPVSYETDASFMSDKYVSRLKLRSWYADEFLYLNDGRALTKFRTGGNFYYGTNKMLAAILTQPKIEGASTSCSIFDPAVEMKKMLPARCRHIGNVTVNYKGRIIEAYRILADYGPLKKIEMTVDKNGVVYAYVFIVNNVATEMRLTTYAK